MIIRNICVGFLIGSAGVALMAHSAKAQTNMSSSGQTYKDGTTKGASSGRRDQERGVKELPVCSHKLGTIAIVEPDKQWWRELNLGSPEAVLKVFVQQSGCFTLVNRGRSMQSRAMERALADSGELQAGSNQSAGQVKTADFFIEPDIVSANRDSGGANIGGALGGLMGGTFGSIVGGVNIKKKEANVTLSVVDARTTEEIALTEGYARKTDIGFSGGGSAGWWGGFAAAGGGGYQNTEIGQVIVLAYLDAYTKLVNQLQQNTSGAAGSAGR